MASGGRHDLSNTCNPAFKPTEKRFGIEMWRARNGRVRWRIRRFPDGPQSISHDYHVSTSLSAIPDGRFSLSPVLTSVGEVSIRGRNRFFCCRYPCWKPQPKMASRAKERVLTVAERLGDKRPATPTLAAHLRTTGAGPLHSVLYLLCDVRRYLPSGV